MTTGSQGHFTARLLVAVCSVSVAMATVASPAAADFGSLSVSATALERDGTLDFQAGSQPFSYTVDLELPEGPLQEEPVRVGMELPAGLVGNPLNVPRCDRQAFEAEPPLCPGSTQVGVVNLLITGLGLVQSPLYNLESAQGSIASLGFAFKDSHTVETATVRAGADHGISIAVPLTIGDGVAEVSQTIWGVPADRDHDLERVCPAAGGGIVEGCASTATPLPFLTLPASCSGPPAVIATLESATAVLAEATALSRDAGGSPSPMAGCQSVPFSPTLGMGAETTAIDTPSGFELTIHQPQPQEVGVLAEAPLKDAVMELPKGIAVNPGFAAGLASCSPAQIGWQGGSGGSSAFTPAAAECPPTAKIGTAAIRTPFVDHPLAGAIYLADPDRNPFGALLAAYLAVADPETGIVLKLPLEIEADPFEGRLRLRFENAPQLPFEDVELSFRGGARAALRTPKVCGESKLVAELTPWSAPQGAEALTSASFRTDRGVGGAPFCPRAEADAPLDVDFSAGTLSPIAGDFSSFMLRLSRADGTQALGSVETTLPEGLLASIASIPRCGEAEIALGSCPQSSQVGSVTVRAGLGSQPLQLQGNAFLAGPYKGAPLSLELLTPAVAGPFDLGTVAVRVALHVDRFSARVRAASDPLPTILRGIPLDVRSLSLSLDRPEFALNPTSCEPQGFAGTASSALGTSKPLRERFQVGNCAALPFKPRLGVRLVGSVHRGAHPETRVNIAADPREARLRRVAVTLPGSILLDSRRIAAICDRRQLEAGSCPEGSVLGAAKAWTPLLDRPLEGPVRLISSGRRLPALAVALNGQVPIELRGRLEVSSGRLKVSFPRLPDAPVSRFVLRLRQGGPLVASGGICASGLRARVDLRAQSGSASAASIPVRRACP